MQITSKMVWLVAPGVALPDGGTTTANVAIELVEDGIEVLPLPDLAVLKATLQLCLGR